MKVCVIQPHYSFDPKDLDSCVKGLIDLLHTYSVKLMAEKP